jgi:hypothetical protein
LVGTELQAAVVPHDDRTKVLAVGRGRDLPRDRGVPLGLDAADIEAGDLVTALRAHLDETTAAAATQLIR